MKGAALVIQVAQSSGGAPTERKVKRTIRN